jgi:multidrug efflux pump subunit AcrB
MKNKKHYNIAGLLADSFIDSKVTLLLMLIIVTVGIIAVSMTPRMYDPEIKVPAANIIVQRPDTPTDEMENQLIKPIESIVGAVTGVDHTFSFASDDFGVVTVQFKVGEDQEKSLMKLYNKIMRNMDKMPKGTLQPVVNSIGVDDIPIVTITLFSDKLDYFKLRNLACKVLDNLRGISNIGTNYIIGGAKKAFYIHLNPQKMSYYGIGVNRIVQYLKSSNVFAPAGYLTANNKKIRVVLSNLIQTKQQLENIIITVVGSKPIFLKDLADVEISNEENNKYSLFSYAKGSNKKIINNQMQSVTITIAKKTGSNAVVVADSIVKRLNELKGFMIPQDVGVEIMRNYGKKANRAVNTLIEHLSISIFVVAVILIIFLGWRESLIVTVTVPLVLMVVLFFDFIMGQSINRITLFALILSLGLLVDSGIVVIENIHRRISLKEDAGFDVSIVESANEIGNPTNVATIAVIMAFIPMAFVGGMMGPFMRPIPINVPIAMIISVLIAYTVVPYISKRFLLKHKKHKNDKKRDILQTLYKKSMIPLLRSKKLRIIVYVLSFVLLTGSMLMPMWQFIRPSGLNGALSPLGVEFKLLPESNVNTFLVEIKAPFDIPAETTLSIAQKAGMIIGQNPYVLDYQIYSGMVAPMDFGALMRMYLMTNTPNIAQIRVNLIEENRPQEIKIISKIYKEFDVLREQYKDVKFKVIKAPPGPPTRAQILAQLYGPDYNKLRQSASLIEHSFRNLYDVINVDSSVYKDYYEYKISLDYDKAMLSGISPMDVSGFLYSYMNGNVVKWIYDKSYTEPIYIIMRLKKKDRSSIEGLLNLRIANRNGDLIPIKEIASIKRVAAEQPIYNRDQHRVVYVNADMMNFTPVYGLLYLDKKLNGKMLENGVAFYTSNLGFLHSIPKDISQYQIRWGGDMRLTLDVFRDLGIAFMFAILFIYFILVGYYKSFVIPVIVMGAIPLTIIGIFPGHWILSQPFTATSMIGVIALAGVVVRNSLLLIDFILEYESSGRPLNISVLESGAVRFRPILLTALAIVFGSATMLQDPIFNGLAISLIFGTLISTLLTLVLIPSLYFSYKKFIQHKS